MKLLRRVVSWVSPRTPRVLLTGSDTLRRDWFANVYCPDGDFATGGTSVRATDLFHPGYEYYGVILFINNDLKAARMHLEITQRNNALQNKPILIIGSLPQVNPEFVESIQRALDLCKNSEYAERNIPIHFEAIHVQQEMVSTEAFLWFSSRILTMRIK